MIASTGEAGACAALSWSFSLIQEATVADFVVVDQYPKSRPTS